MKNRGITIAILYIPYETIQNPNSSFASNEDGYANNNIANIPAALQTCASPEFFLHREHARRHPERAAGDVRAGREHGPHHPIGFCRGVLSRGVLEGHGQVVLAARTYAGFSTRGKLA